VKEKTLKNMILMAMTIFVFVPLVVPVHSAFAWSNGGWTTDLGNPKYGTHDWIAEHALAWLPQEKTSNVNLTLYLYGTELPDNSNAIDGTGIGDTTKHHVYYYSNGTLQADSGAVRAQEEYDAALYCLGQGDWQNASKYLGAMTHYISDLAVFGHVMGSKTDWGPEQHHSDYEDYVETRTETYNSEFTVALSFDGTFENESAYDAALTLAHNTTFGDNGLYNCTWMDTHYNWTDPAFKERAEQSLNLAVNIVAEVLNTFLQTAPIPEFPIGPAAIFIITLSTLIILVKTHIRKQHARARFRISTPPRARALSHSQN
jgi:hypothetical protein